MKDSKVLRVIKWILDYVPEIIAVVAMCIAIPISAVNAFSRYVFEYTFTGYDEFIRLAFAWVVFPGAAAAYWRHMHFGIDLIVNLFPAKAKRFADLFTQLFMAVLLSILFYWSIILTLEVGVKYFPMSRLSYAYYDMSMVVGFGFMAIYAIIFLVQDIKKLFFTKNENTALAEGGLNQ